MSTTDKSEEKYSKGQCFVIMPISDPNGYEEGHFRTVYEDIFIPAIEEAGFQPKRADDDKSSSMIQVNIIKDIIEAPMAICDLSSRNPNVLFELGIRQAFDLPVVLVQEKGTPRIFDISTINTINYRSGLIYREVIEDRENIREAIEKTKDNQGINSIIKLLEINKKAKVNDIEMTSDAEDKLLLMTVLNKLEAIDRKINRMENDSVEAVEDYVMRKIVNNYSDTRKHSISKISMTNEERIRKLEKIITSAGKYRVYEVAKELDMTNAEVLDIINKHSSTKKSHMTIMEKIDFVVLMNTLMSKASE